MSEYDKLAAKLKEARSEGLPFVTLSVNMATKILNKLYEDKDFKVGDEVEVTAQGAIWYGSRGRITHFEPLAETYPISVEFGETNHRRAMGYFNKYQIKKVADG